MAARQIAYLKPVEMPPTDREMLESHAEQIAELQRIIADLTKKPRLKSTRKSKSRSKLKLLRNDDATRLGRRLRAARTKLGLSVAEVAEQVGVSQSSVYFWETDFCRPREQSLNALCKVLKLPVRATREMAT